VLAAAGTKKGLEHATGRRLGGPGLVEAELGLLHILTGGKHGKASKMSPQQILVTLGVRYGIPLVSAGLLHGGGLADSVGGPAFAALASGAVGWTVSRHSRSVR
jgi:hypothetical protein